MAEPVPPASRRDREHSPDWLRRAARSVAVAAVIAVCAALPWVVPGVPAMFTADAPALQQPFVTPAAGSGAADTVPHRNVRILPAPSFRDRKLRAFGRPTRVVVPRLGVDSAIVPISGLSGVLLPPSDAKILGWWQEGRRAGAHNGAVALTGHTVHDGGGALDNLADLDPGDLVTVGTTRGQVDYWVTRVRVMSTARFARESGSILSQSGPGRLVLITCDDWNGSEYLSSAVVVARPVADRPRRTR